MEVNGKMAHGNGSVDVEADAPLGRERRAIVVVDAVESVRLTTNRDAEFIARWRRFVAEVRDQVLPRRQGRLVKHLGDGMLLDFVRPLDAATTTLELQQRIAGYNLGHDASTCITLRAGVHIGEVLTDELDIYGEAVNLAARIASIAKPEQCVCSAEFKDELVPGVDVDVDDLGECWLKHVEASVHLYSFCAPQTNPPQPRRPVTPQPAVKVAAMIAVVPLACQDGSGDDAVIGDLVADGVIASLSLSPDLKVLSHLSSARLKNRDLPAADLEAFAGLHFVVTGSYAVTRGRVSISIELVEVRGWHVIWADRLLCTVDELLQHDSDPIAQISQCIHAALLEREAQRAQTSTLPNLESFALLYGGIGLLHRSSSQDFQRASEALTALSERVPRNASAHAWLAKWHCLRVIRGQAAFNGPDGQLARWHIEQALDRDPDSSLAWALNVLVQSWVHRSLDTAEQSCERALALNPNESLAWLFRCTIHSWRGQGEQASQSAERALELSRLDPIRYYYETLSASGLLADGHYGRAIALCNHSLRLNRVHTPTHRVLAISQALAGQIDAARATVRMMLSLQPGYTTSQYLDNYPGGRVRHALRYADALRAAGLPD